MQPQQNNKAILIAVALIAGGVFFPQIKAAVLDKSGPAPVVTPDKDTSGFVPSDALRTAVAGVAAAAVSEPDKSTLPLRAAFYADLADAVELAGDKVATTEQFTIINSTAGKWTFQGKSKTPGINAAAEEFLKSWVIANEAGLPAERRAKLIDGLRGISWAIRTAQTAPTT